MSVPKISVIMPVYNCDKFISQAVKSVLDQTFKDFELIIIDDGSTDKTLSIIGKIQDKRIKVFRNEKNLGIAKSLNEGLKLSRGKYIARADADDINMVDRFKIQINFLEKNIEFVLVGSNVELIDQNDKKIGLKMYPESDFALRRSFFIRNQILHPTVMMIKKVVKRVGGYNTYVNGAEDYDLFFRLMEVGKVYNIQKNLVKRRIHENVVTNKNHIKVELLAILVRIIHLSKLVKF